MVMPGFSFTSTAAPGMTLGVTWFSPLKSSFCNGADSGTPGRPESAICLPCVSTTAFAPPSFAATVSVGLPITSLDRKLPVWMNCPSSAAGANP